MEQPPMRRGDGRSPSICIGAVASIAGARSGKTNSPASSSWSSSQVPNILVVRQQKRLTTTFQVSFTLRYSKSNFYSHRQENDKTRSPQQINVSVIPQDC